jgi:hypothetical protein
MDGSVGNLQKLQFVTFDEVMITLAYWKLIYEASRLYSLEQ